MSYANGHKKQYTRELELVQSISDHLVLDGVDIKFFQGRGGNASIGLDRPMTGVIEFTDVVKPYALSDDIYRTAAEEFAHSFASHFNNSLSQRTPQGSVVALSAKDVAYVEGSQVHFDLGVLRKLLDEHTIAHQLPGLAQQFSIEKGAEVAARQVARKVQTTIALREHQRQEAKQTSLFVQAMNDVMDGKVSMREIAEQDKGFAEALQANFQNFSVYAQQYLANPDSLEQMTSNPDIAATIVRMADVISKNAEKAGAKEEKADKEASSGKETVELTSGQDVSNDNDKASWAERAKSSKAKGSAQER